MAGGSLWQQRKSFPLSLENAAKVMKQIVKAINDCHANNVAHRDIKEEHFAFASSTSDSNWDAPLKLLDFGEAVLLQDDVPTPELKPWDELVGSYPYLAPEVANNNLNKNDKKTFSVYKPDVWASGVMAYQISTG